MTVLLHQKDFTFGIKVQSVWSQIFYPVNIKVFSVCFKIIQNDGQFWPKRTFCFHENENHLRPKLPVISLQDYFLFGSTLFVICLQNYR